MYIIISAYKYITVILVGTTLTSRNMIRLHYLPCWVYKTSNRSSRSRSNPTTLRLSLESVSRMTVARALQCLCLARGWTASPADILCKPGEQVHAYFAGEIEQSDVFGLREPCNPSLHDCWFDAKVKDRGINLQLAWFQYGRSLSSTSFV